MTAEPKPYRVLARAYRPTRLSELVGQEPLVRALGQAFASGRIAQAYLLTGIRGTGKTTTARVIAKCLNCVGPDGTGGVTAEPCGVCEPCKAIAEGRHIDVLEIDAATNTGIDHVRELVENSRYAPADARYKVYIIDEVHMLSTASFNGLLKTLEEPPPHVRFILATTEVRKIPVTVLSRCQRYDLRRIEPADVERHLAQVVAAEGAEATADALALIARLGGGSMRDSLSILDQAITHGGGTVEVAGVQAMVGLVDRSRTLALLGHVAGGEPKAALDLFRELMAAGGDPKVVVEDLLALSHELTRDKLAPEAADAERAALAERLGLAVLARAWQVLLRGLDEVGQAPDAMAAAEMLLVRLACMADLPPPGELLRRLEGAASQASAPAVSAPASAPPAPAPTAIREAEPAVMAAAPATLPPMPHDLDGIVRLLRQGGEPMLAALVHGNARPAAIEPGRLRLSWLPGAPQDANARLAAALHRLTGRRWGVDHATSDARTLAEIDEERRRERLRAAHEFPHVRRVLDRFPGATILTVETRTDDVPALDAPRQQGSHPT